MKTIKLKFVPGDVVCLRSELESGKVFKKTVTSVILHRDKETQIGLDNGPCEFFEEDLVPIKEALDVAFDFQKKLIEQMENEGKNDTEV